MKTNGQFEDERDKIVKGLEEAYRRLVVIKKQNNSPLVVSRNGEVTEIAPDDIPPTTVYKRKKQ